MRVERVKDELYAFWQEVGVENWPRLKDPREWAHVYVDFWVSLCAMSYTVGHILAFAVPIGVLVWLFR